HPNQERVARMRFGDCLWPQGSVALAAAFNAAPVRNRYAAPRQSRSVHAVLGTSFFRPGVAQRPSEATGTRLGRGFATILACRTGVESSCWFAIEEALNLIHHRTDAMLQANRDRRTNVTVG